ncbi:MAG: tetratricopeptide repeat protein, partial [Aliidongia sp.]
LVFEKAGGGDDLVPAEQFALAVNRAGVPLIVLNACRSGMLGEAAIEAAVATRLLESGAASVVAMGYSVYAVAAAEFMTAFYEALFAQKPVSQAVSEGRLRLHRRRDRPSQRGPLPLEDWIVPVHYLRRAIRFDGLSAGEARAKLSLDDMLDNMRPGGSAVASPGADALAPDRRFIGRDGAFYTLELALRQQHVVLVQGPAGTGKTELAKAFGRWWQATGGVDQPDWVFFHSFEPGLASFGLDGAISSIGLALFGANFIGRTQSAEQRSALILKVLCERRLLLIWDNFETLHDLPDPSGATPPLSADEQRRMRDFLHAVARDGKSGVIITSRTPEIWLGDLRRVPLDGLTPGEAAEMADDVLTPWPIARRRRRDDPVFVELMDWLAGNPLSLRLLLPQLEQATPVQLLAALKGNAAALPAGFVDEGRLASLGASLKYSFDHLAADQRESVLALSLFEGVVDEDVLGLMSAMDGVPPRFSGIAKAAWAALLDRLAGIGVLTSLGAGMYRLHPALPAYLTAEWRRVAGADFATEQAAAELALLAAYADIGDWLYQQIGGGAAEIAFALIDQQRRTMGRLLGLALTQQRYAPAQALMQPLNKLWNVRGLGQEVHGWVEKCRAALEDRQGTPPDLDSAPGSLWLFAVGIEANKACETGDLRAAHAAYDAIRQQLEASRGTEQQQKLLAVAYNCLGRVAQDRGDLAAAKDWLRQSLATNEALGDRPGLANNYQEVGILAQRLGDLAAAADWYRRSLVIREALGDRPGLATSYNHLGWVAQDRGDLVAAEDWYRQSLTILAALGDRPGLARSYHHMGLVEQRRGDLVAAEDWYRQSLTILAALGDRPGLARSYHQLGIVAQLRGDLAAAADWYRQSLAIEESLGNRPCLALTYAQLGLLCKERNQPEAALDWVIRCNALFPDFPNPQTGTGPGHLVRLTIALGLPALEASWQRCTGGALPDHFRDTVIRTIAEWNAEPPARPLWF